MDITEIIRKRGLLLGLSPRTIKTYTFTVQKFFRTTRKIPQKTTKNDIEQFLLRKLENNSPGNTINVYVNALKFFFEEGLNRKLTLNIRYSKVPKSLPTVLTKEELVLFLDCIDNDKHKLMIALLYSAGLRVSELIDLKVKDLDLKQGNGWVRKGKGNKDRPFIIAESLRDSILEWINHQDLDKNDHLFKNYHHKKMSTQTVRRVIKKALKRSNISKNIHPHTLRHSFATHFIEDGNAVNELQGLLGNSSIETTMIYTHLANPKLLNSKSPFDSLSLK